MGYEYSPLPGQTAAQVAAAAPDDLPFLEAYWQNLASADNLGMPNQTWFQRVPSRGKTALVTATARWRNGATVNGSVAVSVWTSSDGGVTLVRAGGTGPVVQAGINAEQTAACVATVPLVLPVWVSIGASVGATGVVLYKTGWTAGFGKVGDRQVSLTGFDPTANQAASGLAGISSAPWVMVS